MHDIEPYYGWREYYSAEFDKESPFYGRSYSEFECSNRIYNYFIHPQWDSFGSSTLFAKILYADYEKSFSIIELIGEWNDCLYNDIMFLKRNLIEYLNESGVRHFILLGENILNFHYSDGDYYEEWWEDLYNGWIAAINFRKHVADEFKKGRINNFISFRDEFEDLSWRAFTPEQLFHYVHSALQTDNNTKLLYSNE